MIRFLKKKKGRRNEKSNGLVQQAESHWKRWLGLKQGRGEEKDLEHASDSDVQSMSDYDKEMRGLVLQGGCPCHGEE